MTTITEKSSKDEILSQSVECIDSQAETIQQLKEQKQFLIVLLGVVFTVSVLF